MNKTETFKINDIVCLIEVPKMKMVIEDITKFSEDYIVALCRYVDFELDTSMLDYFDIQELKMYKGR